MSMLKAWQVHVQLQSITGRDDNQRLPHSPRSSLLQHKRRAGVCARHAFGDQYRATDLLIGGPGKLELVFTPAGGGAPERHEVHQFDSAGVALGMCVPPVGGFAVWAHRSWP